MYRPLALYGAFGWHIKPEKNKKTMKISTITANKLLVSVFSLVFNIKTWKALAVIMAIGSFIGNYYLLKAQYNFKCSDGGYFTTKAKCADMADAAFYRTEYYRLSQYENPTSDIYHTPEE